jgi:SAM-dependent methyltransferase
VLISFTPSGGRGQATSTAGTAQCHRRGGEGAPQCGALEALRTPRTRQELAEALHIQRLDLLEALLDLGVSVGELRLHDGCYSIAGSRSRLLVGGNRDGFAALIEALHTYYNSVYRELPGRLAGQPNGNHLEHIGELVARVSRISEPFMRNFVRRAVAGAGRRRILEVGCGSGAHLRTAAEANPALCGVGLEIDPAVVKQAQSNLEQWGLRSRFLVLEGDIRRPPAELAGPFDVITLYNLVYYFPPEERSGLLASLRPLLAAGGVVAIVTIAQSKGTDAIAANLDVATRSMVGCWPLPDVDELQGQLREAGFSSIGTSRLMPGAAYFGIAAALSPT